VGTPALSSDDVRRLACPRCRGALAAAASELRCGACGGGWPVRDGLPRLYDESAVRGTDRLMRLFYDGLPALHDPVVRLMLPVIQGVGEDEMRAFYVRRLELDRLTPRADGAPPRILEVGVGCGANVPLVRQALPVGLDTEIWGCDLSAGMLGQLRRRLAKRGVPVPRLVQADAHALPFPDHAFDRVFHVGGIGAYRDPRGALAEMARVAAPGTPIVVVDEQVDRDARLNPLQYALFRAFTFYDRRPHCPVEHLPAGATAVREEQAGPAFYCLTFRIPA
jgi:uncharacterized protein YbaR (Trm112 family)